MTSKISHAVQDSSPTGIATLGTSRCSSIGKLCNNIALKLHGHKHNLAVSRLRHVLQCFELSNLHRSGAGKNVCCLSHQSRGIDFCASRNDFGFSNPLLLCSRRERSGHLWREDDILDEDAFNGDTPFVGNIANDLGNLEGNCFTFGDNTLDSACADYVSERRLGPFDECLSEVGDTKCSPVRIANLEVDYRVTFNDC